MEKQTSLKWATIFWGACLLFEPLTIHPVTLTYGIHYPQGLSAVNYIYGSEGNWRSMAGIRYTYNYYSKWAEIDHPFNFDELLHQAQTLGSNRSCRDANGHILLDYNQDLEIHIASGYAFHEHNGKGTNGDTLSAGFHVFWYDDNSLAKHMANSYGRSQPDGLYEVNNGGFVRWSPVDGSTNHFTPYHNPGFMDQICLDILFYLGQNNIIAASNWWQKALALSQAAWDGTIAGYRYDSLPNYHLGLFAMATGQLLENSGLGAAIRQTMLQHYLSARRQILDQQEIKNGVAIGWRGSRGPYALINSESVSCCVLGLGANTKTTYEAGIAPMAYNSGKNYYLQPHRVMSALTGISLSGFLYYGPYKQYPVGSYTVQFALRANNLPSSSVSVCRLEVVTGSTTLASVVIAANQFPSQNQYALFSLPFANDSPSAALEFRVFYYANSGNLDLASIRVK